MKKTIEALIISIKLFRTRQLSFTQQPRSDPTSDAPVHEPQLGISIPVGSILGPIHPFNEKAPTGANSLSDTLGIYFIASNDDV